MKKIKPYVLSILIALAVGGFSALLTMNNMNIYSEINTPALSPPAILFPIVWTILYILMGISAAMIYTSTTLLQNEKEKALFTYALSLFFNFTWSIIFFNLRAFAVAFIWLVVLWILILKTIVEYSKINRVAAYLQIPYLIWVSFAGYLNLAIFLLNR